MDYEWFAGCNPRRKWPWKAAATGVINNRKALQLPMALRVERLVAGDIVVLRLSGRIDSEGVHTLRELLQQEEGKVAIDLKEVALINREAIRFLALSEVNGLELRNCADYVGEWISREKRRK